MDKNALFSGLVVNHFTIGLAIGLFVALLIWLRDWLRAREMRHTLRTLREHLHTKLEIDAAETERRKRELESLRQERDNLRNMVQVLNQKPGKPEQRQMQLYQRAVEIMFEKSPGFAPVWQMTLKEAEEELARAERGIIPFFRRMAGGSTSGGGKRLGIEQDAGK